MVNPHHQGYFRGSYYEHACKVQTEKDVLFTDITGTGFRVALSRWFYDMFLLSYSDVRCRFFYTSSHALRIDRQRQFRRYRSRIHPLSKFWVNWTKFIVIITIMNRLVFHRNTSVIYGRLDPICLITGIVFECILILDFFISLKTGYIDKQSRAVTLDTKKCLMRYCSTKMFLHVASILPLQAIMLLRLGLKTCVMCRANTFVCVLKLLSIVGLFRLYDTAWIWNMEGTSFKKSIVLRLLRIFVFTFVTMVQFLNFTDLTNVWVIINEQRIYQKSYMTTILSLQRIIPPEMWDWQLLALQFAMICKSIFLFNYGLSQTLYYTDAINYIGGYCITNAFLVWAFIEWYAIVYRSKSTSDHFTVHKYMTVHLLQTRQVSDAITSKILNYYDNVLTRHKFVTLQNELLSTLPHIIRREMTLSSHYAFIKRIPYFSNWPVEVIEDLTVLMKVEVFSDMDVVVEKWTPGEGLMVLRVGTLAVYSADGKELGHLIDGDYFGELSLITDSDVRSCSVIAISNCLILTINKKDFRGYMRSYPRLFFNLKSTLINMFLNEKHSDEEPIERPRSRDISTLFP